MKIETTMGNGLVSSIATSWIGQKVYGVWVNPGAKKIFVKESQVLKLWQ